MTLPPNDRDAAHFSFAEFLKLHFCLFKISAKTLVLRFKILCLLLKYRCLAFEQSVLVVCERDALLKDCGRSALINKLFYAIKKVHMRTPNA